jgi:hypothetical protein
MRKEWILTDEEKHLKREKIVRNRMIKKQAQIVLHQQTNDLTHSNPQTIEVSFFFEKQNLSSYFLFLFSIIRNLHLK